MRNWITTRIGSGNQAFHRYIYQFCGNERLLGIIDGLMQYSHRYPQYYTNAKQISRSIDRLWKSRTRFPTGTNG